MKNVFTCIMVFITFIQINGQENNLFTKMMQMEEFIPFIATNFQKTDSIKSNNITLLIPINEDDNEYSEQTFILKHGLTLLSNRLNENDNLTIVAYGSINGEVLEPTNVKEIKAILYAVNNPKQNISKKFKDGIKLGYDIANANFNENAINTLVILRGSTALKTNAKIKNKNKPKNNTILLTLLSITPEVLKILK